MQSVPQKEKPVVCEGAPLKLSIAHLLFDGRGDVQLPLLQNDVVGLVMRGSKKI